METTEDFYSEKTEGINDGIVLNKDMTLKEILKTDKNMKIVFRILVVLSVFDAILFFSKFYHLNYFMIGFALVFLVYVVVMDVFGFLGIIKLNPVYIKVYLVLKIIQIVFECIFSLFGAIILVYLFLFFLASFGSTKQEYGNYNFVFFSLSFI
eukprot:TRINITY_DN275_c0_g1_i2.p1 TRINITY_DN275_c0_g1~~TRINITY_DN275_c0_g1_i2.p1  ORF type:complete len:153 (-),score=14.07 TRINITY_DN275_c0_g1_i2:542-1000(-)